MRVITLGLGEGAFAAPVNAGHAEIFQPPSRELRQIRSELGGGAGEWNELVVLQSGQPTLITDIPLEATRAAASTSGVSVVWWCGAGSL